MWASSSHLKAIFQRVAANIFLLTLGRVITSDKLASFVADAWSLSLTPLNIMSGFKKPPEFTP